MNLTRRHFLALAGSTALPLPAISTFSSERAAAAELVAAYTAGFDRLADALVDVLMQPPIPHQVFEMLRRDVEYRAADLARELVRGVLAETIEPTEFRYHRAAVAARPDRREVRRRNTAASRQLKARA